MKKAMTSIGIRARTAVTAGLVALERKKSVQELKPEIDKAVLFLQNCDNFTSKQATRSFSSLSSFSGTGFVVCDQNEFGLYLIEIGYVAFFPKLWKELQVFVQKDKWNSTGFENLITMLDVFWNCANECKELGDELIKLDAAHLLFEVLQQVDYKDKRAYELMNPILGVLQNIIHLNSCHRNLYRKENGVMILETFLDSSNVELKTDALMILAYIVEEKDNKDLADKGVLGFLVNLLKSAINTRGHVAYAESGAFSSLEILDGLNHLAVNDDNKKVIEKENAIPLLIRMLQKAFSDKEKQLAAEGLWNLAFVESIRVKCLQLGVVPALEALVKSENEDLRQACISALWQIKGVSASTPSTSDSTNPKQPPTYSEALSQGANSQIDSPQIMISYQWDSQKRALEIRDRLTAAGHQVWMDVTNMKGDILHAMADGVENSNALLMCMTEKYKESRSCRSEATYAYKLGKTIVPLLFEAGYQPDGWLGILQGMDLYYEVHSIQVMENNMEKLLKAIEECIGKSRTENDPVRREPREDPLIAKSVDSASDAPSNTPSSVTPAASKWTQGEVQEWFKSTNLLELCDTLDFCDGDHLHELYNQLCQTPQDFKNDMKTDFQMSAKMYLQFSVALKKLFKE